MKLLNSFKPYFWPHDNKRQNILYLGSLVFFLLYVFSIPACSNIHNLNLISIGLCGAMCAFMALYTFLYGRFKINIFIGLLIVFNIIILLTHVINRNIGELPKTIILMSVVAFFVFQFASSCKNTYSLLQIVLLAGVMFALLYIFYFRAKIISNIKSGFSERLGAPFDDENEIAKELSFFGVIAFTGFLKNNTLYKKIILASLFALFAFLALTTGSISNLLTLLLVCTVTAIWFQNGWKRKIISISIIALAIGLFAIVIQIPALNYFKSRIANILSTIFAGGSDGVDGSAFSRLEGALIAFKVGLNKMLFGFGYMGATNFTQAGIQAHNNFIELFVDFGVIGLVIYEALVLIPIIYSANDKNKAQIMGLMVHMLVFQLFLTTYYKKFEYIFLASAFAVLDETFKTSFVIFDSSFFNRKKQKSVIFEIIPALTPVGGAESFITNFVIAAKKKHGDNVDIKVILLYNKEKCFLNERLENSEIEVIQLNKKTGIDIRCSLQLRELIFRYNPAIIHTHLHSIVTLKLAVPFKRKFIKNIHTIHHNCSGDYKKERVLYRLIKTKYLTPICVAEVPSREYSNFLNMDIQFIDNGVNLDNYDNSIPLYKRKHDFLVVGRFVEVKNQLRLIDIINEYMKKNKYTFTFLGDGPLLEKAKEKVSEFSLDKKVSFEGCVTNVPEYMSDSKVLVLPSLNEGNPMVINEAFASGMVVVGNDVGGIHNLLSDLDIGGLSSIDNNKEFADFLTNTIVEINKKKLKTADYSKKDFSIEKCVDKYFEVFGI